MKIHGPLSFGKRAVLVSTHMKKVFTKNEIIEITKEIISSFKVGNTATIVALSGDLGAGKTTVTQQIAKELGVTQNVISPTFVIMKTYELNGGRNPLADFARFIHIDAYRLKSHTELMTLGFAELLADPQNLILIEWPEMVAEIIPKNAIRIKLSHINENEREIEY